MKIESENVRVAQNKFCCSRALFCGFERGAGILVGKRSNIFASKVGIGNVCQIGVKIGISSKLQFENWFILFQNSSPSGGSVSFFLDLKLALKLVLKLGLKLSLKLALKLGVTLGVKLGVKLG